MGTYWTNEKFFNAGTLDASGANTIVFAPGETVGVKRIILVTTIAQTVADATISVAVRDVDDGNSVAKGSFVLPFTGSATDDVKFVELGKPLTAAETLVDGSIGYDTVPGGVIEVLPGQEMSLVSDGGGNAGTYQVYFQYQGEGFNPKGNTAWLERTFTHA